MSEILQVPMQMGQVSGEVLFYSRPEPLSVEAHGGLALKAMDAPYAFAARAHAMPALVSEFGPASMFYPVIFAGDARAPMVVTGLRANENLFVDADGRFEEGAYLPAFMRRYPFVLAAQGGGEQMVVCIDRDAAMLQPGGETPLFVEGKLSRYAEGSVEFCRNFETERLRTEQFVRRLIELDLFEAKAATFTPRNADGTEGQLVQIADYFCISEEKLAALKEKDLRELVATGALRQIHAHLNSMFNWERLVNNALRRGPLTAGAA